MPIISLSTLTTLPTTKHWLTDWVTCSQACFYLCCVLKYIFITYQMLNGCSCRLNAKNETLFLCTHKKAQIVLIQHQFYYLYLSVSLFRKASQHVLCFLSYTLLDHTASKKKQKETASTTDNESKTVLTFGLLNNTGFFFTLSSL